MGRMKSLAYAYAQYISAETGEDEMDVFGDIVDGGVDIPKWFISEWLVANPIFASEENDDKTIEMLIARGYILSPNGDPTNPDHWSNPPEIRKPTAGPTSWTPAAETFEAQIGYDGARGFLSTMKGRIEGANEEGYFPADEEDFQEFVLDTIEDHIEIADWEERYGAENSGDYQIPYEELDSILEEMDVIDDENYSRYEELERKYRELTTPNNNFPFGYGSLYYDYWNAKKALEEKVANLNFGAEDSEDYEVIMTNIGHSMERDGRVQVFGDVVFGLPENRRSRISSFGTGADKAEARQALIDRATGYLIEEEQLHDYMTRNHLEAETKSWRFQKRDSSGKFIKGFVEEVEISELPENLPLKEVSLPVIFEEQDVLDFINGAIADDNFPEKLSDPKFIQLCSDVAAAAPMALLKHLNVVANIRQLENLMSGSEEETVAAGRAIFVTDFMLNFKEGQDYWAAEEE